MNFGSAFENLRTGFCESMRLPDWGENVYVKYNEKPVGGMPYLELHSGDIIVPWHPSTLDIMSMNWDCKERRVRTYDEYTEEELDEALAQIMEAKKKFEPLEEITEETTVDDAVEAEYKEV